MTIQLRRPIVAALVALLALVVAQWFDAGVLVDAQRQVSRTFDSRLLLYLLPIAHLSTAATVVAVGLAAWWSRSRLVGIGYAVVGGVIVFLPAMFAAFATGENGASPLAPEPIASTLMNWFATAEEGATGAVLTVGAAMLLSGVAVIVATLRLRSP